MPTWNSNRKRKKRKSWTTANRSSASVPIPVVPPLPRGAEPEDIFTAVVDEETAADDDLEGPQGYELEEEEEEVYEEDKPAYEGDEEAPFTESGPQEEEF